MIADPYVSDTEQQQLWATHVWPLKSGVGEGKHRCNVTLQPITLITPQVCSGSGLAWGNVQVQYVRMQVSNMQAAACKSNQADKGGGICHKSYIYESFSWPTYKPQVTEQKQFKFIYKLAIDRLVKCPHKYRDNLLSRVIWGLVIVED